MIILQSESSSPRTGPLPASSIPNQHAESLELWPTSDSATWLKRLLSVNASMSILLEHL